jgi:hypothetical protein
MVLTESGEVFGPDLGDRARIDFARGDDPCADEFSQPGCLIFVVFVVVRATQLISNLSMQSPPNIRPSRCVELLPGMGSLAGEV